jgi:polyhydroxyalkanoate synthesis repressor PhaR
MPLIKRYPNRKLYDTEAKHYVSLDDIAGLIREGAEVQVVDHATGEDVTSLVLMQIIVGQEKRRRSILPQPVITDLIQAGGDTLAALHRGLASPLDLFRQVDEEIERRIRTLIKWGDLGEEDGLRLRDKLLALGQRAYAVWPDELKLKQLLADRGLPTRDDVRALVAQLDVLEAELERIKSQQESKDTLNGGFVSPDD